MVSAKVNEDVVKPFKFKLTVKDTMKFSALVGYTVGKEDGEAVGAVNGMTEGLDVEGAGVGMGDGRVVGPREGTEAGRLVGPGVGMG